MLFDYKQPSNIIIQKMTAQPITCFVCLEESSNLPMKRLCQTCAGSTICQRCETMAQTSSNPDILTVCPICRSVVNQSVLKTKLISVWHPGMLIFWWWWGVKIPFWQQTLVSITSYEYISRACRTINETTDNNRPSTLLKRWKILNNIIHIPYLLYTWYQMEKLDDQGLINSYLASHVLGPISILFVLKFFFRILAIDT